MGEVTNGSAPPETREPPEALEPPESMDLAQILERATSHLDGFVADLKILGSVRSDRLRQRLSKALGGAQRALVWASRPRPGRRRDRRPRHRRLPRVRGAVRRPARARRDRRRRLADRRGGGPVHGAIRARASRSCPATGGEVCRDGVRIALRCVDPVAPRTSSTRPRSARGRDSSAGGPRRGGRSCPPGRRRDPAPSLRVHRGRGADRRGRGTGPRARPRGR